MRYSSGHSMMMHFTIFFSGKTLMFHFFVKWVCTYTIVACISINTHSIISFSMLAWQFLFCRGVELWNSGWAIISLPKTIFFQNYQNMENDDDQNFDVCMYLEVHLHLPLFFQNVLWAHDTLPPEFLCSLINWLNLLKNKWHYNFPP